MKIGIHLPNIKPEHGGCYSFVHEILDALGRYKCNHDFVVIRSETPEKRGLLSRFRRSRSIYDNHLNRAMIKQGIDVAWFLSPTPQPVEVPYNLTVWDLAHRMCPYFPEVLWDGWSWEKREEYYSRVIPKAARVITGTEVGKCQIQEF